MTTPPRPDAGRRRPQHAATRPRRTTITLIADRASTAMLAVLACGVLALVLGVLTGGAR